EELGEGHDVAPAIARSIGAVGAALAASAGTVICGLSLMAFAEFAKVRCAGPAIAMALTIALLGSLTLTPALLNILGPKVVCPGGGPRPRTEPAGQPGRGPLAWLAWFRLSFWEWVSHKVVAHPLWIWSVSVLILLPLAVLGLQTIPICRPTGELSPAAASIRGLDAIQRH